MTAQALIEKRWKIGRLPATSNRAQFAFYLRRAENGGIRISGMSEHGITDSERQQLFSHFGSAQTALTGGQDEDGTFWTGMTVAKPGTESQFIRAVYMLPFPFTLMGGD